MSVQVSRNPFGIRSKLVFMSAFLLVIPWLGYQYILEMEEYLRRGQEQTVLGTAQALATEEERARRIERKLEREADRRLELQGEIAALDVRLNAEASKTDELQDAVARAVAARSRAELELEFAEEELEALRNRALPRQPDTESDPSLDQPTPDS